MTRHAGSGPAPVDRGRVGSAGSSGGSTRSARRRPSTGAATAAAAGAGAATATGSGWVGRADAGTRRIAVRFTIGCGASTTSSTTAGWGRTSTTTDPARRSCQPRRRPEPSARAVQARLAVPSPRVGRVARPEHHASAGARRPRRWGRRRPRRRHAGRAGPGRARSRARRAVPRRRATTASTPTTATPTPTAGLPDWPEPPADQHGDGLERPGDRAVDDEGVEAPVGWRRRAGHGCTTAMVRPSPRSITAPGRRATGTPGWRSSGGEAGLHEHGAVGRAEVGDDRAAVVGPGARADLDVRGGDLLLGAGHRDQPRLLVEREPARLGRPAHHDHAVDLDRLAGGDQQPGDRAGSPRGPAPGRGCPGGAGGPDVHPPAWVRPSWSAAVSAVAGYGGLVGGVAARVERARGSRRRARRRRGLVGDRGLLDPRDPHQPGVDAQRGGQLGRLVGAGDLEHAGGDAGERALDPGGGLVALEERPRRPRS